MDQQDKSYMLDLYSQKFKQHGYDLKSTLCDNPQRQWLRFDGLARIADMRGYSVLDIGCGLGHFKAYLAEKGWAGRYVGLDLNPDFIAAALKVIPESDFAVHDITETPWTEQLDYGIISGIFNYRISDPWTFLTKSLVNSFASVKKGLTFNFLTDQVNTAYPEMAYFSPAKVLDFCLHELSPKVVMDTHFMDFNVVCHVYR